MDVQRHELLQFPGAQIKGSRDLPVKDSEMRQRAKSRKLQPQLYPPLAA